MENRDYGRYALATPFTAALAFLGLATGSIAFFIAASIPPLYILLSSISRTTSPENIKMDRKIENEAPSPGQKVKITVEAENKGRTTATDLRVIDSVPEGLKVQKGSPRASLSVTPGSKASFSYEVVARRGRYTFNSPKVEIRGRGNKAVYDEREVIGDQILECKTGLEKVVLRDKTDSKVGDITTSEGGEGLEFHSLRDYKNSDPLSRVEWRQLAKTGELATKKFREERSGRIILVVDARPVSDVKAEKGHPSAVDLSAYAAERTFSALLKSRHKIGLAVLGERPEDFPEITESPHLPYVKPGRGSKTRRKIKQMLKEARKDEDKVEETDLDTELYNILPPNSQVVFFTPLMDDKLISTLKVLNSHNFPPIVVSPDVTYSDDPASRLESIRRDIGLKKARKHAPVIDWNINQPMSIQISKALRRIYGGDLG